MIGDRSGVAQRENIPSLHLALLVFPSKIDSWTVSNILPLNIVADHLQDDYRSQRRFYLLLSSFYLKLRGFESLGGHYQREDNYYDS